MILYDSAMAPNPRRVRVFLAEKGISVPTEQVDIGKAVNREPAFRKKNPLGTVPVLELDDGTCIAESMAICRYFEGTHPEPRLMGVDPKDAAIVEMWNRRMELEVLANVAGAFRNTHAFFKGRIAQVPEYGAVCKAWAFERLEWLEEELAGREFIAGDRYSVADITAMCGIDFGAAAGIKLAPEQKNLARWHATVAARPSAKA